MGASQRPLVQAAWLKENQVRILEEIDKGTFAPKRRPKSKEGGEDREKFNEWCLERTSYTLRNFSR